MTTPLPMNVHAQARILETIEARASVVAVPMPAPVTPVEPPAPVPPEQDPRIAQLIYMFQRMDDRGQRTLMSVARTQVSFVLGGM